jgi:hypothetical protein
MSETKTDLVKSSTAGELIRADDNMTPQALMDAIEREKEMRAIMVNYCKSQMVNKHHYYSFGENEKDKKALTKEGALNLCSVFKVIARSAEPSEKYYPDGHYSARATVELISQNGSVVAVGTGSCSTKESKYAYRWCWESEVPAHLEKAQLPQKSGKTRSGGTWKKFRVQNEDLADQYNTVLKMADKRALVAAVCKLPLVSEIFTQDVEEKIAETKNETKSRRGAPKENKAPPVNREHAERVKAVKAKFASMGVGIGDLEKHLDTPAEYWTDTEFEKLSKIRTEIKEIPSDERQAIINRIFKL